MHNRPLLPVMLAIILVAMAVVSIVRLPVLAQRVRAEERIRTTFEPQPWPQLIVTNTYSSPITGLLIANEVTPARLRGSGWGITAFDPTTHDPSYKPIEGGESRTFRVGKYEDSDPTTLHPEVKALIFEDSTSAGDPAWVMELRNRRRCHLAEINTVEALLTKASEQGLDNAAVVSALKQRAEELKTTLPRRPGVVTNQCLLTADGIVNSVRKDIELYMRLGESGPGPALAVPHAIVNLRKHREAHTGLKY